jgi:peptidoglycan hydrolase CwlO-like protein
MAMNTSGEPLPSPAASEGKKRPGRPRQTATETQKQKVERIQEELRQAQAALRVSEERRAAIVGAAALRHARHHAEFARKLAAMLRAEVKAKADRATVADLLLDNPASPPPASFQATASS